jgi:hypothetical protein
MDRYTRRAEASGWLVVKLTKGGARTSLPEYTRVSNIRDVGDRTFFTIADGYISVGEEASLARANAAQYLSKDGPGGAATVTVQYQGAPTEEVSPFQGKRLQQWAKLTFAGQTARVTLNSIWNASYRPIAGGTHTILAPDYSHANISTAGYAQAAPGMIGNNTWFPIGLNGSMVNSSRYIHVGHLSEGCVTVYQLEQWAKLYRYLISRRVPGKGGKVIGSLVVRT